ncbi:MAG: type transporter [Anaerocolumna sp.]|nr:type transporter [Anaerocolumna sp.]
MTFIRLVKRNILVYARNRSNIFFSLLSMLIIIGLMAIFLGNMNVESILNLLSDFGGRDTARDRENAKSLVLLWTLAGIVMVNAITITLAMVGIMVEDEESKRLQSFYVSPVKRSLLVLGYITAAFIMGVIMCTLTVLIGLGYGWIIGGLALSVGSLLHIFLLIVLIVFTAASLVFFITNFVHSSSAFSGLSTIIGTLVGFLAAIYLPMGALPDYIQKVLKVLPLLHGSSLLRKEFTREAINITFKGMPKELVQGYELYMGVNIGWKDVLLKDSFQIVFLIGSGLVLILLSSLIQKRRNISLR